VGAFLARVSRVLAQERPIRVLEAGCGEGYVLQRIRPLASGTLVGVDRDRAALRLARERLPEQLLVCADIHALPFRNAAFDTICCFEVLEHLASPSDALQELTRLGSRCILLSVPWEPLFRISNLLVGTHWRRLGSDPGHVQAWSRRAFSRFLQGRLRVREHVAQYPWQIVVGDPVGLRE
jgi:SAM-dependent methyltransferase